MRKMVHRRSQKTGLPPGTIVHIGENKKAKSVITIFDYTPEHYEEKVVRTVEESFPFKDKPSVTWINIDGIQETEIIEKIDTHFGIHPLVLEDIVNTSQRPKMEDYGDYIFVVFKMLFIDPHKNEINAEQIGLIIGPNYVISFQETQGDVFDPIRDRIRNLKGRVRKMGADYLAYVLLDAVVDNYFVVFERLGDEMEKLEEELLGNVLPEMTRRIHHFKRDLIFLRKQVWPLREVISGLERSESRLIKKTTGIFMRDLYDHVVQVIDTIETYRDILTGMQEVYLASISTRMNEVMKVLTIITTLFVPLTFIVGVYGMNFEYIPELKWKWGYYGVLACMCALFIGMLVFFKRRKWVE